MTTPETPSETPGTAPRNDRRRWRRAYLLGAGSVLAVELVVAALVAAFVLHPPVSVAGTAVPAQPAPATPSRTAAATDGPAEKDADDENADVRYDMGRDT